MKKQLILAAVAVVAMASCAKNEAIESAATASAGSAIGFESFIDRTTKGSETDITALQTNGFGVIGYNSNSGSEETTFANKKVTYDSATASWTYETTEYWTDGDDIAFYAYSPYDENGTNLTYDASFSSAWNNPTIKVATSETLTEQSDVVVATASGSYVTDGTATPIDLAFNHILSKIGFSVQAGEAESSNPEVTVYSVKVTIEEPSTGYSNGVVSEATYDMATGTWSTLTSSSPYLDLDETSVSDDTVNSTTGKILSTTATNITDSDKYLFIIPQKVEAATIKVTVNYDVDSAGAADKDAYIPEFTFEQAKSYVFNITLADTAIRFGSVSVTGYEDGTTTTIAL